MNEFVIDQNGYHIWYDLKSDIKNIDELIDYGVECLGENSFWVRLHREDGPALICKNGYQAFYVHGKKHLEDGPAIIFSTGYIEWCLDDEYYYFDHWCEKLNKSPEEINFLKLKWNII